MDVSMRPAHVLIHFDELGLRRRGRTRLERVLRNHLNRVLPRLGAKKVRSEEGRITVPLDGADFDAIAPVLARTPGISWFAAVHKIEKRVEAFRDAVVALAAPHDGSFRITVKRSTKRFPVTSMEIARQMGAAVVEASGRPVDLHTPRYNYRLEIADGGAYLYTERHAGWGGMPPASAAPVVALVSGGADSAVAAFRMTRRGCAVRLVHFAHAAACDGARADDKIDRLASALSMSQGEVVLHAFDVTAAQETIADAVFSRDRVVAYRLAMGRVATRVADAIGADALVTGDVIAQAPSQSVARIAALHRALETPVLTPVIGDRREDLLEEARRLDLRAICALAYEDCLGYGAGRDGRAPLDEWLGGDDRPMAALVQAIAATESTRAWRLGEPIDPQDAAR